MSFAWVASMSHEFVVSVNVSSNIGDIGAVMCIMWLTMVEYTCNVTVVGGYGANPANVWVVHCVGVCDTIFAEGDCDDM